MEANSGMEANSSGEEVMVKARKPYTITKQRERWTEEEHNRFLEAVKLYGRAWQRIEEHIGTKTAVQIRSHAQKFFTKLEKEALMKGVPLGQAIDIEIPPPRPKRKPCGPYPRKTGVCSACPIMESDHDKPPKSVSSPNNSKQLLHKEISEAQEMAVENETLQRRGEASEDGSCSEVLNLFRDCPSASISYVTQDPSSSGTCREFVSLMRAMKEKMTADEPSHCTDADKKLEENDRLCADPRASHVQIERVDEQSEKECPPINEKPQDDQVPPASSNQAGNHASANCPSVNISGMSSINQSFTPFTQFQSNQDVYRSFHDNSSTLSNLIATTLLQNPALHAAASLAAAASLWPPSDVDSSNEPSKIHASCMSHSPSMSAIAAATVSAASAWWASQGLLPLFPPIHPVFAFSPAPVTVVPIMEMARNSEDIKFGTEGRSQNPTQDGEALLASKLMISSPSSLSESDGSEGQVSCFPEPDHFKLKPLSDTRIDNTDKERNKKVDRSSSGSNIPSGSEVETNAVLKDEEAKHEAKQVNFDHSSTIEANNRRSKSSTYINESWKEVTEEGRLAFQALFNREVLPQSFPHPQTGNAQVHTVPNLCDQGLVKDKIQSTSPLLSGNQNGALKGSRTGFKPYKRCSVEAIESTDAAGEETSSKRTRRESETSA